MRINNNIAALKSSNILNKVNQNKISNIEKLSSGLRINKASDDAAGLVISESLRTHINGQKQAVRNCSDSQALLSVAEGGLANAGDILQRMRVLAVEMSTGIYGANERAATKSELDQLTGQLSTIATTTKYNDIDLLSTAGSGNKLTVQTGSNSSDQLEFDLVDLEGIVSTLGEAKVDDVATSTALITSLDAAIKSVNDGRATIGANVNRLSYTINTLNSSIENLSDSESRIRDLDMSTEMVDFSKNGILAQTGSAMLSQANAMSQGVLQLF